MLSLVIFAVLGLSMVEAAPHRSYGYHHPRPYYYYKPVYYYQKTHHKMMHPMMDEAPAAEVDTRTEAVGDVVDVAVAAGTFTTLATLLTNAGLVDTLKGAEALTVFAPSDEAFAKIPSEVLESLSPEEVKAILLRHVVTAKVPAAAVTTGDVETIGGESIGLVKTAEGGVQINYNGNTVNVVAADVAASNGVIHVIDAVIL